MLISNFSIRVRLLIIVLVNTLIIAAITAVSMFSLSQIRDDLKEIAETDLVMVRFLTTLTEHQLEQALFLERAVRDQALIQLGDPSGTFAKSLEENSTAFLTLSKKVVEEFHDAEDLSKSVADGDHPEAVKEEFLSVFNRLVELEQLHEEYDKHALELLDGFSSNSNFDLVPALKVVEEEEETLVKGLEELLHEVEAFITSLKQQNSAITQLSFVYVEAQVTPQICELSVNSLNSLHKNIKHL